MKKCFVCGSGICDDHPCFNFIEKKQAICMGCEGSTIAVWRVSLSGSNGGYYDRDFDSMGEGLRHMEPGEMFEIHREEMSAAKYLSLPEFSGF
jgi:hypothetical protein